MELNQAPSLLTCSSMVVSGLAILYANSRLNRIGTNQKSFIEQVRHLDSMKGIQTVSYSEVTYGKLNKKWEHGIKLNPENPTVLLIPHNDGTLNCPFNFYQNDELIISNKNDFTEIRNLPQLLHQITDIMVEAYDAKVPIFSVENFGLKLTGDLVENYSGSGELVYLSLKLDNKALVEKKKATNDCSNEFLDVFMGWNYGDLIKSDITLEGKLLKLNAKMLTDGNRHSENKMLYNVTYRTSDVSLDNFYKFEMASERR